MVLEGQDSTIRPKVQTFHFDNGKLFMDAWAADGKANFSRRFIGWSRVGNVLACTGAAALFFFCNEYEEDNCFAYARTSVETWWSTFTQLDVADVQKAKGASMMLQWVRGGSRSSSSGKGKTK